MVMNCFHAMIFRESRIKTVEKVVPTPDDDAENGKTGLSHYVGLSVRILIIELENPSANDMTRQVRELKW